MMSLAATSRKSPEDIPLMSKQTAREDILKMRDPDAEADKALAEMGMALPPILATQIAAALEKRGHTDLAQDVMMLLNPQQGGQQGGQPQIPPELLSAAVEALSMNPETAPIAQAIMKVMGAGQQGAGAPPSQPSPASPPAQI